MNILVVDDNEIFAEGLVVLLQRKTNFNIKGLLNKHSEVMLHLRNSLTDFIIFDVEQPDKKENQHLKEILKEFPAIKILVISRLTAPGYMEELINAGIYGFIEKNTTIKEVIDAIYKILKGETYYGRADSYFNFKKISLRNRHFDSQITQREKEVLKYIINGNTTLEICHSLCVAKSTIDSHRKNLLSKLGVRNTPEMIKLALVNHLI